MSLGADGTRGGSGEDVDIDRSDLKPVKDAANWDLDVPRPAQVEALIVAGETLLAAGANNGVTPADGFLWAVSAAKGRKLAEHPLPAPPVYNGLAAARGRLFVATQDGRLTCLGSE